MDVIYACCCGLDVHLKKILACRIVSRAGETPRKETRTFGTMTEDLLALLDWLLEVGVSHVAMESTGVYWKPIYNLLEGSLEVLLVNVRHLKTVPGRKTDVKDAEWIAECLRHGLLQGSFVPDRPQRELRELTRYRTTLVRERAAEVNRLQKTLEGANIKLATVVSDILGKSAREMLEALVAGEKTVPEMAQLARGRMREKIPLLEKALVGRFTAHQQFLVARQLAHIDHLEGLIEEVSAEIGERLRPFEEALERLETIPGVARRTAEALVAEIGVEMERFPSAKHLASWAGMCPGNHESGGKSKSGKTRKGSPWLRSVLVEAARGASRKKETYAQAQYRRLAARRGKKKAAVAVGHAILVAAYHILKEQVTYHELGAQYFDERDRTAVIRYAVRRLEALGLKVNVEPLPVAA